jgi:hypothetical protein
MKDPIVLKVGLKSWRKVGHVVHVQLVDNHRPLDDTLISRGERRRRKHAHVQRRRYMAEEEGGLDEVEEAGRSVHLDGCGVEVPESPLIAGTQRDQTATR